MSQNSGGDGAWGAAARDWAEAQEGTMRPIFEAVLDQTGIGPGRAVLDVACGTGLFCALAQARGAHAAGVDASAGQLAVARERVAGVDFREGAMEALPFADGTFDLITCCNALQYAGDPARAVGEMRRVGRPGATVGILTISREGPHGAGVSFAALEPFRAPPGQDAPEAPGRAIFRQPGALEAAIAAAGLAIVTDAEVECDWDYPDLETALRGILSFAPGVRAIRAAGAEPVRASLAEALAPFRTPDGGYHLPNRARYVLARAE